MRAVEFTPVPVGTVSYPDHVVVLRTNEGALWSPPLSSREEAQRVADLVKMDIKGSA